MKDVVHLQEMTFFNSTSKIPVKKKLHIDFEGIVPPAEPLLFIFVEFPKYRFIPVWQT